MIRKIDPNGVVSLVAGSTQGYADGFVTIAQFNTPWGIDVDGQGNIFVGDFNNHKIRKITTDNQVYTLAGSFGGFADGVGAEARFYLPSGVSLDTQGNLYVADRGNHRIRKVSSGGGVTTLAGSDAGFGNGDGSVAQFSSPIGILVHVTGSIYVADSENNKIRRITPDGLVSTWAGSAQGYEDGPGPVAMFNYPSSIVITDDGVAYVSDAFNHKIRKITEN